MKNSLLILILFTLNNYAAHASNDKEIPKDKTSSPSYQQLLTNIYQLESRLKRLEAHVAFEADDKETYMPGWVMFAPEKQLGLWYRVGNNKNLLTDKGYNSPSNNDLYNLATCGSDSSGLYCLAKFPVLEQFSMDHAKGYVLNIAIQTPNHDETFSNSISCSDKHGEFNKLAHYRSNGFMNYRSDSSATGRHIHIGTQTAGEHRHNTIEWKSGLVYCPVVKRDNKDWIFIRFGNNPNAQKLDGKNHVIHTIGTVLGYW